MLSYLGTGDGYTLYPGDELGVGNGFGDTVWGLGDGDGAQGEDGYEDGSGWGDWTVDSVPRNGDGP